MLAGKLSTLALVAALLQLCCALPTVYVGEQGSDSNDGSATSPFATFRKALTALSTGGGTINVLSGVYYMPEREGPITINASTAPFPIAIQGPTSGDPAIISGGIPVTTPWQQQGSIWTTTLDSSVAYFRQMWANGARQRMARTKVLQYTQATHTSISYKAGDLENLPADLSDINAVMYESWTASLHEIASIDQTAHEINFTTTYNNQWSGSAAGSRYYLQNFIGALDAPGEFYFNRSSHVLSWYPPTYVQDPNNATVIIPQLTEIVVINGGARDVSIKNVFFQSSAADVSSCFSSSCDAQSAAFLDSATIHVSEASEVRMSAINVTQTGGYAIWFAEGCFNSSIHSSRLADLGAGGVRVGVSLSGEQTNASLRTEHITVTNNVIEDGGRFYQEGCGVLAQSTAFTAITHNLITNFSYTGVSLGWNWGYAATSNHDNLIAYNAISYIGQSKLSDMGCIYTLGTQANTVVDHNVCHDVYSFNYGGWGLYTDEGSRFLTLSNNIIYHTKCAGFHQHYGLDNVIINNVFADVNVMSCDGGIRSSQHPGTCDAADPIGTCSSYTFERNIAYLQDGPMFMSTIPTGFQNMSFDNNTYFKADGTTIVFPESKTFAQWRAEDKDLHSVIGDPEFTNPIQDDFSHFLPSSPSLKLGFQPINISSVGPTWARDRVGEDLQRMPPAVRQHVHV